MSPDRPDIVLVVLDTVRRDHLSCYGHTRPTTPNIDRIAGAGVRYTRASAASCWTLPSHASLFTGLYPSEHRADVDTWRLAPEHETLASRLRALGYATACISCNGLVSEHTGLTRGFELQIDVEELRGGREGLVPRVVRSVHRRWRQRRSVDRGARRATGLARAWLRERPRDRPFFLFLNYMDCHLPYHPRVPAPHRFVAPADRRRAERLPMDPFAVMAGRVTLSAHDLELLKARYDEALLYLDTQVGALDRELAALGRADRTLFVVTADHGESFGEHGLMDHQYGLYEHLIGVPLIARLPGRERAGSVDDRIVQQIELPATIGALVGDATPAGAAGGASLLDAAPRTSALAEYLVPNLRAFRRRFPDADVAHFDVAIRSVRTLTHKLIWWSDDRAELYRLEDDPTERRDIAATRADLVGELKDRIRRRLGDWPRAGRPDPADDGVALIHDRLQALGYL